MLDRKHWVIRPAECAIRNFTIGRKNWLFSDSPKGAKTNADIQQHPEHLDDVLPWNEPIQQNCK